MKSNIDQLFRVPYENDTTGTLIGATSSIRPFVSRMSIIPVTIKAIDVMFGSFIYSK